MKRKIFELGTEKLLVLGFFTIILLGTVLLMLPAATKSGEPASLKTASFTAVSSTCVTGLILHDTYTFWSLFGQIVILILIQIGGLGFITIFSAVMVFSGKKFSLSNRLNLQHSLGSTKLSGMAKMTKFIIKGSLIIELAGTAALSVYFVPRCGVKGIYFALFESISEFCNSGLDIMGQFEEGSSLHLAAKDVWYNLVIIFLVTVGGLGYFVWKDIIIYKFKLSKYSLHSKIVLVSSAILTFGGALVILLLEFKSRAYEGQGFGAKLLESLFQSVTCRSAGFETVPLKEYSSAGRLFMCFLMLVGGSSGSTAGGMKTTTISVVFLSIVTVFKKRKSIDVFGRRLEQNTINIASSILITYLSLVTASTIAICAIEKAPLEEVLFETTAAVTTVGLTLGLTPTLSTTSHIILMILMFVGRIGGLTMILAFSKSTNFGCTGYPEEKIIIG